MNTADKYIYKFMPFNKYALLTIINHEIYFADPSILNDPIDCLHNIKIANWNTLTQSDLIPLIAKYKSIIIWNSDFTNEQISQDFLKEEKYLLSLLIDIIRLKTKNKYGVCSFSINYDDQRLWSHYADSSKGLCLIFEKESLIRKMDINTDLLSSQHRRFYDGNVNCDEKPYEVEISNGEFEIKVDYFFKKTKVWEYENEYRLLMISEGNIYNYADYEKNRYYIFPKESLKGIILGEKTTSYDLLSLLNIKSRLGNIEIYKIARDVKSGKLKRQRIQ